jgi:hypothetical protein
MKVQGGISFMRGIDEPMRIRKELNIFNLRNQQLPKMYNGERRE